MMCVVDKHYREVDGITLTRYEVVVTESWSQRFWSTVQILRFKLGSQCCIALRLRQHSPDSNNGSAFCDQSALGYSFLTEQSFLGHPS